MSIQKLQFGGLIRQWRVRRRMSQAELAFAADSSTRHLSYLETGRSNPSRAMVICLAEQLKVSLRETNTLLLAAGFAPAFQEHGTEELAAARIAIDRVLNAHQPYPAFAVDRHWNVVLSNRALPLLYENCSAELLKAPINAVRLILHPDGLGPQIINYSEWHAHTMTVLRQQLDAVPDAFVASLLQEISGYALARRKPAPSHIDGSHRFATPLRIATRFGTVSFLNTNTVFANATDITLSELCLEMLFPADEQTERIVRSMAAEQTLQPGEEA